MNRSSAAGLRFCKMSGAGNDFVLINLVTERIEIDPADLARAVCRRRLSVGADGLVLVGPADAENADVRVRFWNPDGSQPATCGNGTRCAARFAVMEGLAGTELTMETAAGPITARVDGSRVALRYSTAPEYELDVAVTAPDGPRRGHRVRIGNPHFVLRAEPLPEGPIEPICRPIRQAPELAPDGANVHLVEVRGRHRIRIRTYELGVEAETLACGSGSMSSALSLTAAGAVESPVTVETRSGEELTVRFVREGAAFRDLELEGPAHVIYRGELYEGALHAVQRTADVAAGG